MTDEQHTACPRKEGGGGLADMVAYRDADGHIWVRADAVGGLVSRACNNNQLEDDHDGRATFRDNKKMQERVQAGPVHDRAADIAALLRPGQAAEGAAAGRGCPAAGRGFAG